jgi:hypothetical protein
MDNLQYAKEVMPLYIESAKTFAQTSSAALALTIIFKEKILGVSGCVRTSAYLVGTWAAFLLSVGTSVLYQWMAVRWIIALRNDPNTSNLPAYPIGWLSPHLIYGAMVTTFYAGALLFVISAARELRENGGHSKR